MPVSKSEYVNWRNHSVTKEFIEEMIGKADGYIATLVALAGKDPQYDRWVCGQIDALKWLVDWEPKFYEDEEEEDIDA